MFFAFLACLLSNQNVHASGPSYDILYYGGTLTLDTWDDATYEEELFIISKILIEGSMLAKADNVTGFTQLRYAKG